MQFMRGNRDVDAAQRGETHAGGPGEGERDAVDVQGFIRSKWSALYGEQTVDHKHPDEPLYVSALEWFNDPSNEHRQALISVLKKETDAMSKELSTIGEQDPDRREKLNDLASRIRLFTRFSSSF